MKKEIADMWCDALRSGEYKQVKGTLCGIRKDGEVGYCCLGVLTDLYIKDRRAKKKGLGFSNFDELSGEHDNDYNCKPLWDIDGSRGSLPESVARWAGFDIDKNFSWDTGGFEVDGDEIIDLATMNDGEYPSNGRGASFRTIANTIEKYYDKI